MGDGGGNSVAVGVYSRDAGVGNNVGNNVAWIGLCVGVFSTRTIVTNGRTVGVEVSVFRDATVGVIGVIVGLGVEFTIDSSRFPACSF